MYKYRSLVLFALLLAFTSSFAAIPERPNPPRLVNDYAGLLQVQERDALENKLVEFSKSTTTQIVVVIVNTLDGNEKSMYATELGHAWGVGQKDTDNGIIILVKEKTADSKGEVFIAPGYGLEGVIPDATAKRIVENEMIPRFREGNYLAGIDSAVNTIMKLSLGEFSAKEYEEQATKKSSPFGALIGIVIFFFIIANIFGRSSSMRKRSIGGRSSLPFWVAMGMMNSGSRNSGSFGNFTSGGGSFGGFGGGGFGGGGAGGSW